MTTDLPTSLSQREEACARRNSPWGAGVGEGASAPGEGNDRAGLLRRTRLHLVDPALDGALEEGERHRPALEDRAVEAAEVEPRAEPGARPLPEPEDM
jgi:hypothetical protein